MTALDPPTLAQRFRLAFQQANEHRPAAAPSKLKLLREASYPLSPLTRRIRRAPQIAPARNPKVVLMLPGFIATPVTMRYLSQQIERAGHKAKRWNLGLNTGPTPERVALVEQRVLEIRERYGSRPVLLGWSLGGMFAREIAHRQPDAVGKVITLGSPFSGNPRANNAWRLYQFIAGHSVDAPPVPDRRGQKPPVETVAFWSKRDGVIAVESARGEAHERDRAIEADCTHLGFSYSPAAIEAIAAELDRD